MARYLFSLLFLLLLSLLLLGIFNRAVNPFAIFAGPDVEGFNHIKPEADTRQRMSKAYQVLHRQPEAIILGTSRALALKPRHPHWQEGVAFNLALTSSSLYEQWRYLQHAVALAPVHEVVIGLDHFMFHSMTRPNFSEARLAVSADGTPQWHPGGYEMGDLAAGLLSLAALSSSRETLRQQGPVDPVVARRQRVIAKGGHRALFTEMERGLLQQYAADPKRSAYGEIGRYDAPGSLRKIFRLAHQQEIALHLFISPSHARMWELWRIVGLDGVIDEWKRAVVAANEEEARLAGQAPFPLWDFSGYNTVTTERLPGADEVEQIMFGYWEGSHYSDAVAELILDRLFSEGQQQKLPADFGVLLNSENIDDHLQRLHLAGQQYRSENRDEIAVMESQYSYYRAQ